MQIALAASAALLSGLAIVGLIQFGSMGLGVAYGFGALLAAIAFFRSHFNIWTLRFLAGVAALVMFYYFASYFSFTPYRLSGEWYNRSSAAGSLLVLLAAFGMMPIVAAFSCQMKQVSQEHSTEQPPMSNQGDVLEPVAELARPAS